MKRFWKSVATEEVDGGWRVTLDGRPVMTPARRPCMLPLAALAAEMAEEWRAVEGELVPRAMPMTRTASTCLDRVAPEIGGVRDMIAAYGASDLLCYRAERPAALAARQATEWDPLLDWCAQYLDARLRVAIGVMPVAQDDTALAALSGHLDRLGPWGITPLAELATISGSLVIALAVLHGRLDGPAGWRLSRIDDEWNIGEWGTDAEAAAQATRREADFLHAARILALLGDKARC